MTERITQLGLRIAAGPHADTAQLDELVVQLRDELLELNIERAERTGTGEFVPSRQGCSPHWLTRCGRGSLAVTGAA